MGKQRDPAMQSKLSRRRKEESERYMGNDAVIDGLGRSKATC
jgi:hypothetical protein